MVAGPLTGNRKLMDPEVLNFAHVATIIVGLAGSLTVIGLAGAWAVIRLRRQASVPPMLDDPRLRQIQESIDSVAIEVERIAEAQRFSAKLLSERANS